MKPRIVSSKWPSLDQMATSTAVVLSEGDISGWQSKSTFCVIQYKLVRLIYVSKTNSQKHCRIDRIANPAATRQYAKYREVWFTVYMNVLNSSQTNSEQHVQSFIQLFLTEAKVPTNRVRCWEI